MILLEDNTVQDCIFRVDSYCTPSALREAMEKLHEYLQRYEVNWFFWTCQEEELGERTIQLYSVRDKCEEDRQKEKVMILKQHVQEAMEQVKENYVAHLALLQDQLETLDTL